MSASLGGNYAYLKLRALQLNLPSPVLQSDRLIWLCTEPKTKELLTLRGINLSGAKIWGEMNLEFAHINFPLSFSQCIFTQAILLRQAKICRLELDSCHVVSINAALAQIDGSLFLRKGFLAKGEVNLSGAIIRGNLSCEGSKFVNLQGDALKLGRASIANSVFLCDGFLAEGSVSLLGAAIGDTLDCQNGKFIGGQKDAILLERAKISGSVFFRKNSRAELLQIEGFESQGRIRLYEATIGGSLECDGGKFVNPGGEAISAEGTEIKGAVLLRNEFEAEGSVRLYRSTIGGSLECDRGKFINPGGEALNAEGTEIKGAAHLRNGFEAEGRINLYRATIGDSLDCTDGKFINRGKESLAAEGADIKGSVFLRNGFEAEGRVNLYKTTISGNLECDGGKFVNPEGEALTAEGADIKGTVLLRNGFEAEGQVNLSHARVDSVLEICQVTHPKKMSLNLQFARIHILQDAEDSWTQKEKINLNGCVYDTISHGSPLDARRRLKWLRLQKLKTNFSLQPYEQLAKVLRSLGYEDDAVKVLIAKQRDKRRYGRLTLPGRLWNLFFDFTVAHGYRPQQVLWLALFFVLIGNFLFDFSYSQGLVSPSKFEVQTSTPGSSSPKAPKEYPEFNAFVYSLDLFLPIVDLRQESYWQPNTRPGNEILMPLLKLRWGELTQYYFWLHIMLGWSLTTLWVAGFTGIVRRSN